MRTLAIVLAAVLYARAAAGQVASTTYSTPASILEWDAPADVISPSQVGSLYSFRIYLDARTPVVVAATCRAGTPTTQVICQATGAFAALAGGEHTLRMSTAYLGVEGKWSDPPLAFTHLDRELPGPPRTIRVVAMINGVPVTVTVGP